jgi:glyceraldehyde-3-phosphate dehydrogenase (NAD(P))
MERKIVHVIGTGTIGEPLIGLLSDYRDQLGIDEVTFHKNSALRSPTDPDNHLVVR